MLTRKGQKGQKNIPYLHYEVKTKHTIVLTPTAWEILKNKAESQGLSISEVIEGWARETTG